MITLNILDLLNSSFEDLYKMIMKEEAHDFAIVMEREGLINNDLDFRVLCDYYHAGWIGEKLGPIATSFSYWVPDENYDEPFRFELTVDDKEKLVDVTMHIIKMLDNFEGDCNLDVEASDMFCEFIDGNRKLFCLGLFAKTVILHNVLEKSVEKPTAHDHN